MNKTTTFGEIIIRHRDTFSPRAVMDTIILTDENIAIIKAHCDGYYSPRQWLAALLETIPDKPFEVSNLEKRTPEENAKMREEFNDNKTQLKREWEKMGYHPAKMAVNLSGYVITDEDSLKQICDVIDDLHIKEGELEIEVTETAVMLQLDQAKESLEKLRETGITIAMDDFGTGYSSLTYLHTLPFDIVKIDRDFIKNIKTSDDESFLYKTVIDLAHNMNLTVVAEGIETLEQKDFLIRNHCDVGQGYYFSKPIPANEVEKLLKEAMECINS